MPQTTSDTSSQWSNAAGNRLVVVLVGCLYGIGKKLSAKSFRTIDEKIKSLEVANKIAVLHAYMDGNKNATRAMKEIITKEDWALAERYIDDTRATDAFAQWAAEAEKKREEMERTTTQYRQTDREDAEESLASGK